MMPVDLFDGRDAVEAAPLLLGALLRRTDAEGTVVVRLTEVEAYLGGEDPGSHAFRGPTPRNAPMFGPPGALYVYLSYGMHRCGNLVFSPEGEASAVLLRAGEVVEGVELARGRRRGARADADLARGPGNLGAVMGWSLDESGRMLGEGLELDPGSAAGRVVRGPRTGVALPGGGTAFPWRFSLPGDRTVSPYRASAPRRAR